MGQNTMYQQDVDAIFEVVANVIPAGCDFVEDTCLSTLSRVMRQSLAARISANLGHYMGSEIFRQRTALKGVSW